MLSDYRYICGNCGELVKTPKSEGENFFGCAWGIFALIIIIPLFCYIWWLGLLVFVLYMLIGSVAKQKKVCPFCKNENIVPIETPKGQELYKKYHQEEK